MSCLSPVKLLIKVNNTVFLVEYKLCFCVVEQETVCVCVCLCRPGLFTYTPRRSACSAPRPASSSDSRSPSSASPRFPLSGAPGRPSLREKNNETRRKTKEEGAEGVLGNRERNGRWQGNGTIGRRLVKVSSSATGMLPRVTDVSWLARSRALPVCRLPPSAALLSPALQANSHNFSQDTTSNPASFGCIDALLIMRYMSGDFQTSQKAPSSVLDVTTVCQFTKRDLL